MTTKPVWGATRFGINPQTDMGIPIPVWGLAFLSFFSHTQDRPFLTKNLGNPNAMAHQATNTLHPQIKNWVNKRRGGFSSNL
jgi:hypothetical protein